jgi:hypothetical protein
MNYSFNKLYFFTNIFHPLPLPSVGPTDCMHKTMQEVYTFVETQGCAHSAAAFESNRSMAFWSCYLEV